MKGKGPDPRNWGNLSACEDELDLEAQREALASWKAAQELARSEQESKPDPSIKGSESDVEAQRAAIASWNKAHELAKEEPVSTNISVRVLSPESRYRTKTISEAKRVAKNRTQKPHKAEKGKETPTKGTPDPVRMMVDKAIAQDKSRRERHKTPRAMEPVEQIDPRRVRVIVHLTTAPLMSLRVHPDIGNGKGSETPPATHPVVIMSQVRHPPRTSHPTRMRRQVAAVLMDGEDTRAGTASREDEEVERQRSRAPVEYDGSVDSKAFHRFITEGTAYVKDGEVPSKKQAFILSHYRWRLSTFFRELFNYCFPVDFRIKLRKKLHTCYQGNRTVRDYEGSQTLVWTAKRDTARPLAGQTKPGNIFTTISNCECGDH